MNSPSTIDARLCGTKGWSVVQLSYGVIADASSTTLPYIIITYIVAALAVPIITVRALPKSRASKIFRKNIWYVIFSPFIIFARIIVNIFYYASKMLLIIKIIFIRLLEAAMGRKMYKRVRWYGYFGYYSNDKSGYSTPPTYTKPHQPEEELVGEHQR
ncbi:MAG: hypothetical protein ACR2PC_05995 [Tsuneonella suprasediminis]|nr:hypothetical protein LBX01_14230 [Altererythrobacter sp. N1]